jgi:predicted membrane-bound spermidine synthase
MFGNALHEEIGSEIQSTGLLTFFNTLGAMFGSLISGLVLIPLAGIEKSFFIISLLYGCIALISVNKKNLLKQQETES